jgi:proline dehydrogenase
MSLMRRLLLLASQSAWLRRRATRYWFMRRSVRRFMPGETAGDALAAAAALQQHGISTVFTLLGENVTEEREAGAVGGHYQDVLRRIRETALPTEVSVKPTQLGLDVDLELCSRHLEAIAEAAGPESVVWIDMESSAYTDRTLELYRRALGKRPNVGVCLQAYLYRTAADLQALIPKGGAVRLVKGAYNEPPSIAYARKKDVDENFYRLAAQMLSREARRAGMRAAFATHDGALIARIQQLAESPGLSKNALEFQMLYGIQRNEQLRLAREGWRSAVLIAYGSHWFPWFMRRLAERPANLWFVLRNLFS